MVIVMPDKAGWNRDNLDLALVSQLGDKEKPYCESEADSATTRTPGELSTAGTPSSRLSPSSPLSFYQMQCEIAGCEQVIVRQPNRRGNGDGVVVQWFSFSLSFSLCLSVYGMIVV